MKAPLSYVPTLPATAGVTAGILLSTLGHCGITIAVALVTFIVLYGCRAHFWAFCCLFTALGIIMSVVHSPNATPTGLFDGKHSATGVILTAKETSGGINYTVDLDSIDGYRIGKIKCQLSVMSASDIIDPGSTISVYGGFSPIVPQTDLPHEPDYSRYLKIAGIQCRCTVARSAILLIKGPDRFDSTVCAIRTAMYNAIVTSPLDGCTSAFLVAVILGDDSMLMPQEREAFRSVGVAHILALSGLHVGIIATLLIFLLLPLQGTIRGHNIRAVITVILIWAYAVVVGFTPSIVRSAVMLSVFSAAWLIQRGYRAFNSLLLSILIILCINPLWLYAPGFQLSVCAVAAILTFCWLLPRKLGKHRTAFYIVNTLGIPVAAMLGTGIISVLYFEAFPFLFMLGNIVTGLLFPPVLMGGTVLMLFTLCGIHFGFLGFCVSRIYRLMDSIITWLASIDWAVADGLYIDGWTIVPYALCMVFLALSLKRMRDTRLWLLTVISCLLTVITLLLTSERVPSAELYITRTRPTRIIMGHGANAMLWTDSRDRDQDIAECSGKYSGFLKSRCRCDTFIDIDSISGGPFRAVGRRAIIADTLLICMVYDDTVPHVINTAADYAMICAGYRGTASDVVVATGADTLLIATDVYPKVRERLISECADSIPYIDLKVNGFNRIWQ